MPHAHTKLKLQNSLMPCLARGIVFVWLLFQLGCGAGSSNGVSSNLPAIVRANTVVLPSDGTTNLSNITDTSVTVSGNIPNLRQGSVIVSRTGMGLLRKVVSITKKTDRSILQTEPATLEDAFEQLDIHVVKPLALTDFREITPLLPNVTVSSTRARSPSLGITFHFANVKLPPNDTAFGALEVSGDISVGISLDIALQVDYRGVKYAKFAPKLAGELTIQASGKLKNQFANLSFPIAHLTGEPIVVEAGIVPIVFVLVLELFVKANGHIEAGLEFTSKASGSYEIGAEYVRDSGWNLIKHQETTAMLVPTVNVYSGFTLDFTPFHQELLLYTYGIPGPKAVADIPTLRLGLTRQTNPPGIHAKAEAFFKGNIEVKAQVYGHTLIDKEFPNIFDVHLALFDETIYDTGGVKVDAH